MIKLKLLSNKIKKPFRSRENILAIYSPKKYIIPEADAITIDTEINVVLPLNRTLFVTTKFKGQKIKEIRGPQKKRLRITLLNHSYFHTHTVEKGSIFGYLLSPNSEISIENVKKKKATEKLRTENVGLEKILAENVGGKLEVSSAVTISPMLAETWSIKLVKLLLVLLAKLRQTLTKSPNRELIRSSEMGEPN